MKINSALCFHPNDLINFMINNKRDNTLTQEIGAALATRLLFEKGLGWKDYYIYFEPKNSRQEEALKQIGRKLKIEQLENFIDNYAEQNTPIDFSFVNTEVSPAEVFQFQYKIFGIGVDQHTVNIQLADYLKKIKDKYAKTQASLLIQFRNNGTLDISVYKNLFDNTFPFKEVIVFIINQNGSLTFCKLHPIDKDYTKCINFTKKEMLNIQ